MAGARAAGCGEFGGLGNRWGGGYRPFGMRRLAGIVGLGVVLLVTVGCGGSGPVGFGGEPPSAPTNRPTPVELPPATTVPPAGAAAVPAAQVDASGLPGGWPTTVWTTEGGMVVGLFGRAGGCTSVAADLASQDAQRVVIRLVQTVTSEGPCPQLRYFPPLTVRLTDPLGDRRVALVLPRATPGPPARQ